MATTTIHVGDEVQRTKREVLSYIAGKCRMRIPILYNDMMEWPAGSHSDASKI